VLGIADFRFLFLSNLLVFLGFEMRGIAQNWLALDLTNSQAWVGAVAGAPAFATVAFSLIGGAASDRFPKRNILVMVRIGLAAISFSLGYLVSSGLIEVWHLIAFAMVQGGVTAFGMPASMTIAYDIVGRERLFSAISVNQAVTSLGGVFGPALGGLLLGLIGVGPVFVLVGGLYVLAIVATIAIRTRGAAVPSGGERSGAGEILEGLRFAWNSRLVRALLILNALGIFLGVIFPLVPVYARDVLQVGGRGYGVMMGAFGVGTVAGAVGVAVLGGVRKKAWLTLAAILIFTSTMIAFAFSRSFVFSVAVLFVQGLAAPVYMTTVSTMIQTSVPDQLRGRVMGLNMIVFQLFSVGMLLGGALAAATSNEIALVTGALADLVFTLLLFAWSRELREAE
jgi:MFS family permease